MAASCRTYRLQNILISRKNVMQLGWAVGIPPKDTRSLGSSMVLGTQMMGNALLVRVSLRAIRSGPSFRLCSYVRRLAKNRSERALAHGALVFDRNLLRPWVAATCRFRRFSHAVRSRESSGNRICSEYFAKLWTVLHLF